MLAKALNTHIIVSEDSGGQIATSIFDDAATAQTLFDHRSGVAKDSGDADGDGSTSDSRYRWIMWYGKGRLIKYRKMDQ